MTTWLLLLLACRPDPPPPGLTRPPDTGRAFTDIHDTATFDTGPWDPWPCDVEVEENRGQDWVDVLGRLDVQRCLDAEDLETLKALQEDIYTSGNGDVHCHTVYRSSSEDGWHFDGPAERVLEHASVPDIAITSEGHHLLVYNDVTPYKLWRVVRADPERIWRQGLLGYGGLGMSRDRMEGAGFREILDLDVHNPRLQRAVDPDLTRRADGSWRLAWFGIHLETWGDGSPLHADKPHQIWHTTGDSWRDFPSAQVAVASEDGAFGGVDPTLLSLDDGGEVLMMGPMPDTVLGWASADGLDWGDTALAHFDTEVPGATPDAMPDPAGGYRMHFLRNGDLGNFQVATSSDGLTWDFSDTTIRDQEGASNPTVAMDPEGTWWLYWNEVDEACLAEWLTAAPPE